ncbi:MAG: sigma-54 dependent transcriptional regulator [Desulfuromonadaceae bacterium]|nr:sigma-54 dependent transcriptional regulator [Desulfuromonadaceae bacterium]MDD5107253.1 sigma-54 dependent transcriptional regulator [Desulfuromonadaceae bacterium]
MANILIIDDDRLVCQSLSLVAKQSGHKVTSAHNLRDGLENAIAEPFDVVFLDVNLPDGNGLEFLSKLPELPSSPEIIIMTGYGDPHGAEFALKCGAWDYLEKGASVKEISLSLVRALQYRKQKQIGNDANTALPLKRDGIIGNSARLKECLDYVAQAAISDSSVLITGETGTGKELFATAVHQNSDRRDKKFVVVDCASLPENLIEGMLFGHEKGAFTNADQAREGLIYQANGGTLFLDEIGEMPLSLQKVFLRVLQEHRFRPLGSNRELESNFRLVAATNRNLDEMAKSERFRADLLFRISTFVVELPTLRERPEDIKALARHHTDRICEHYGIPSKEFSPEFLSMLAAYSWPGNVRELVNTLERTIAATRFETMLFPKHLPLNLRIEVTKSSVKREEPAHPSVEHTFSCKFPQLHELRDSVYANAEKQYLVDLMAHTGNSVAEACRISDLSQSRLYALLKKHGIHHQH